MAANTEILTPILALVSWTLLMWVWMYINRIPAMNKAGLDPQEAQHPGSLNILPKAARSAADNYNHLHEQPTIFYALVAYTFLVGNGDELNIMLAWAYVCLRVLHSLIQVSVNVVAFRFVIFSLSSLTLMALAVRNILALS
ncbi:MAG: hypothetical protein ACJAVO_002709 [Parvibaculaceae bacterium]|jgi:hypothetical protein|nr:MAPEG family protein [Parvibaculaceae bacterium]